MIQGASNKLAFQNQNHRDQKSLEIKRRQHTDKIVLFELRICGLSIWTFETRMY